ncbi:MAG: sialidase family protein, partial [Spirochaetia bacterium]
VCYDPEGNGFHPMVCRKSAPGNMKDGGLVLMRNRAGTDEWLPSNKVYLSPETSSRGVLEPDAAVLKDGRILVVVRGSDTPETPGRKWMTWSDDGSRTLHPLREFRYDHGGRFYSPSSIHRFIRSSRSGKLYWLANIVSAPPSGNRPRYPLQIAEIDEDSLTVKENSLAVVDDRTPGEPELIQFSNFQVIENRETLNFEIYMTRLGEDPDDPRRAGAYRYIYCNP